MSNTTELKTIFDLAAYNDTNVFKKFVEIREIDLKTKNHFGQTAAHIAAKSKNLKILQYLLDEDPSLVDVKDDWNQSVFHIAVQIGALDIVKYLGDIGKANISGSNSFFPGSTSIHIAAVIGNLDILKYFIEEKNIDVNLKNDFGQTPAFSAAAKSHLHIIKYLVEETNANLTTIDENGENILYMSARTGDLEIPKYLLDEKKISFDLNTRNNKGETILNRACVFNNYYFVKYLIGDKHVDVNIADNFGSTPLHEAADVGVVRLAKYLVENGANPRAKDEDGKTPKEVTRDPKVLDYLSSLISKKRRRRNTPQSKIPKWEDIFDAAEHNDEKAVKYFIEEGGTILNDANGKGETVVHIAARNGNFALLNYMLDKAPFLISVKDMDTNTPLHLATKHGILEVIKYLIDERKANLLEKNYINLGNTVAHIAAETGNMTILKYFMEEKRVDVDIRNDLGQSPVFSASFYKHLNVVKYLFEERKANITMTDVNNDNILYVAARTGDLNLPRYLLDEKKVEFDINWRDNFGETVVHRAARFGGLSLIKYLVGEKRADVNLCDKNSRTPLHEAACMGYTELVKYLIEKGADPEAKDRWNRTHTEDNTYRDLIKEWTIQSGKKRERRNVSLVALMPRSKWLQRILTTRDRISTGYGRNDNVSFSHGIHGLLDLARASITYIKGPQVRKNTILSLPEILQNPVDPFVFDVVHSAMETP